MYDGINGGVKDHTLKFEGLGLTTNRKYGLHGLGIEPGCCCDIKRLADETGGSRCRAGCLNTHFFALLCPIYTTKQPDKTLSLRCLVMPLLAAVISINAPNTSLDEYFDKSNVKFKTRMADGQSETRPQAKIDSAYFILKT